MIRHVSVNRIATTALRNIDIEFPGRTIATFHDQRVIPQLWKRRKMHSISPASYDRLWLPSAISGGERQKRVRMNGWETPMDTRAHIRGSISDRLGGIVVGWRVWRDRSARATVLPSITFVPRLLLRARPNERNERGQKKKPKIGGINWERPYCEDMVPSSRKPLRHFFALPKSRAPLFTPFAPEFTFDRRRGSTIRRYINTRVIYELTFNLDLCATCATVCGDKVSHIQ